MRFAICDFACKPSRAVRVTTGGWLGVLGGVVALVVAGCMSQPQPATRPATDVDQATTQPAYWYSQSAAAEVSLGDFERLWNACEDVLRDWQYKIDRQDYRSGLLTSQPLVSAQFFEPWRRDAGGGGDLAESSLAGIRRTIQFRFRRSGEGLWTVAPMVLVERYASVEKKLRGTSDYDPTYWYPIRRDSAMEKRLAEAVEARLK